MQNSAANPWDSAAHISPDADYSGAGRRVAAFAIDALIVNLVAGLAGAAMSAVFLPGLPASPSWHAAFESAIRLFGVILAFSYYTFLDSSPECGTPGKRIMGIRLTTLDGGRVAAGQALLRYLFLFLAAATAVGLVMQMFTARRQTLPDKIAGTVVIRARQAA